MSSQEIKRKLIENTKRLLKEKSSITIKDIADASYVNIASVNYHFGSKENLMKIVVEEIISELKDYVIKQMIQYEQDIPFEEKLEKMIDYIYQFAMDHIWIIYYLFVSNELQKESSSLLVQQFFEDNEFTQQVYQSLAEHTDTKNPKELYAKYIVLFSSFCIPIFVQLSEKKLDKPMTLNMFKDPEFRTYFIKNILKIV